MYREDFEKKVRDFIDCVINNLIVTSHNEKIKNIIKDRSKRLKGLQRALARCKAGSKNRYKIKVKIQRLWQKIRNARKHLIHDITNKLIKENDIIVCEDLDIKSMYKDRNIAKSLSLNPLEEIIRVLKYKAEWNNKKSVVVMSTRLYNFKKEKNSFLHYLLSINNLLK